MSELEVKLLGIALIAAIAVAVVYAMAGRRRRTAVPSERSYAPDYVAGSAADPARDAFAAAGDERPTEDQIARARLGGTRGAPELGQAPLSKQARDQMPGKIDDGHTA